MNFEVIKRSHIKRNILIGVIIVLILSAIILTFTRAKYRVTQSVPLVSGTINYSAADLNLVAMYLNQGGALPEGQTDIAPKFGYTLNEEQSTCEVNDNIIEDAKFTYENGMLGFYNLNRKGTKCTVYFDLIPDNENPVISNIGRNSTDTTITITTYATDNIGIYYYYFQLDDEEEIKLEENSYTFEGLEKDSVHTIIVRVEDAAGNEASESENITVGLYAREIILSNEGGISNIIEKGNPDFRQVATSDEGMYAAEDDYGMSFYYRGAVDNNWIQFAGFYWRIIRINGDGTIRLIYNGKNMIQTGSETQIGTGSFNDETDNNAYVGYMYQVNKVHGLENSSTIKLTLDEWYSLNLLDYTEYLDGSTGFCGDRTPSTDSSTSNGLGGTGTTITHYGAYIRLNTNKLPILTCPDSRDLYTTNGSGQGNEALQYPIGLITADEMAMAGAVWNLNNREFYLYNAQSYWAMSPRNYFNESANPFALYHSGDFITSGGWASAKQGVRPVINLSANASLTGSGTTSDPYVVIVDF